MIDLEERLRRAADLLDQETVQVAMELEPTPNHVVPRAGAARSLMLVAAVVAVALGGVGLWWAAARVPHSLPVASSTVTTVATTAPAGAATGTAPPTTAPDVPTLEPSAVLPVSPDVVVTPLTVAGVEPTDWYRLQPDLDVAWYSDTAIDESMLCFRSPSVAASCQSDEALPAASGGPIAVQGGPGQFLIVTLGGGHGASVSVTLDDGSEVSALAEADPVIGWSVARVAVPDGRRPVGMWMSFLLDTVEGPGATVPASVPDSSVPDTAPPTTIPVTAPATTAAPPTTVP